MNRVLVLAVLLAGCGGSDDEAVSTRETTVVAAPPAATADGERHFGYIRSVDVDARTLAFDEADFLTGEAADRAAADAGSIEEGDEAPNDYFIRNPDRSTVPLNVAPGVVVTRVHCNGGCRDGLVGAYDELAASFERVEPPTLADAYRGSHTQYWVTLDDSHVVRIDELYLP